MAIKMDSPDKIMKAIKSSYGEKYSEEDYSTFLEKAKEIKKLEDMISLVSNHFDLDWADARDMSSYDTDEYRFRG